MKKIFWSLLTAAIVLVLVAPASAEKFAFDDYSFVWNAATAGRAALTVTKDPKGLRFELGSPGGKVATVTMTAAEAAAVGRELLKAQEYYDKQQQYYAANRDSNKPAYNKESNDIVKTGDFQVMFYSAPKGNDFTVKVGRAKTFTTMALLSREDAMTLGARMVEAEAMEAFVKRHLKF